MRRVAITILVLGLSAHVFSQNTPGDRAGGAADILNADDVLAIVNVAASALGDSTLSVAVVDRTGAILAAYARDNAGERGPDYAVSVARAGAMFSHDQAPLSSRTVRFISGIHFPPGVPNTPNAALYGVENINRGCAIDPSGDAIFTVPLARTRSIAGTVGTGAGTMPLPCTPSDASGCARGGPMRDIDGNELMSVGITTGKVDVFDSGATDLLTVPVNPGGIPIYRGGKVVGGVGVTGVSPELAEYAATLAAAGAGRGLDFSEPLGFPGAVFIEGIRLPFFGSCTTIPCIRAALKQAPPGSAGGRLSDGRFVVPPRGGQQAPERYLLGPRASRSGSLNEDDVRRIIDQSVAVALRTRAAIRLPLNQPTRMAMSVSDEAGDILAVYRMPDSTFFSVDVALTKARNAFYFSTREGYEGLRNYVVTNRYAPYQWEPQPPAGQGWAVTARSLNFGGQPLFPPGIDHEVTPTPGPWFDLYAYDSANPCTEGPGPSRGANRIFFNQSGIVWFAGSVPLYKDGRLVGGLGVSGDGVEQDDYVSQLGSDGFHPPDELRVDNSVIVDADGREARVPYLKFPRHPEFEGTPLR
jgi:uncharacterized protein GlcG (DUF336 family)